MLVTLLSLATLLARAAMPMPAMLHGPQSLAASIQIPGATLCHPDDEPATPTPAGDPSCDHCPLCPVTFTAPAVLTATAVVPLPMAGAMVTPPRPTTDSRPRAPPGRAHPPRGPPSDI
jgi:hypothetical protein